MKILYFDCFAGISGDMTLSALMDLGVDEHKLVAELQKLGLDGWKLETSGASKSGIGAKHTEVTVDGDEHSHSHTHGWNPFHRHHHSHPHRTMADIAQMIDGSGITPFAKELAKRIFMRLAVAEAKVHNSTPEEVHFHEVGAVDSIIDIVGTAICIDILAPDRIYSSTLHDGYGFVKCQHGNIPVPVPAVVEVLAARGASVQQLDVEGEMTTPTGAAIVAELAESFGPTPAMKILKTGYGAGTKDFAVPNLLRLYLGETEDSAPMQQTDASHVTVIETNVDDSTPEILGYVMERLFEAGALDVFFTPVYMKKCRPATKVSIICDENDCAAMENILFKETTTIGLRKYRAERVCLPRKAVELSTPYGTVKAKETVHGATSRVSVEYEDARRLAMETGKPLREILLGRQS